MSARILHGIKVLDQGTFITGPAAAMVLADLGATVIKVEQPETGDPFRAYKGSLYSPQYQAYNRNKQSVTLNTKDSAELAVFDELVRESDVYIQNFRPGAASRLNADAERLQAINPRLVYCSISGFGQDGPMAARPAYDTVAQAASGLLNLLVAPENPRVIGPALADAITGFQAATGILAALFERHETGLGKKIEISMLEAMCYFNVDAFTHYYSAGEVMGPYSRASVSQSYVLQCADKRWIALHMSAPTKFWEGLATAIEQPHIFDDPLFATRDARIENQVLLIKRLGEIFLKKTLQEWCQRLVTNDVPHAEVMDSSKVLEQPQAKHLQLLIQDDNGVDGKPWKTVRSPVSFDGERALEVIRPPILGEHNELVLTPIRTRLAQHKQAEAALTTEEHK